MKNIIFDYDGTLNDISLRANNIVNQIFEKFTNQFSVDKDYLIENFNSLKNKIIKNDVNYPFRYNNELSCYCEDEFILNNVCFDKVLINEYYQYSLKFEKSSELVSKAYENTKPIFSKGLEYFLDNNNYEKIYVVSNSPTKNIKKELGILGEKLTIIGNAKKYFINSCFKTKNDYIIIDNRIVNLNRTFYKNILKNFNPKETIVVGDNFSMDLALPLSMDFEVSLVKNDFNVWAQEYLQSIGKNVINNVCELV